MLCSAVKRPVPGASGATGLLNLGLMLANVDSRPTKHGTTPRLSKVLEKLLISILVQLPYQEQLADMPEGDLVIKGDVWSSKEEFISLFGEASLVVWVVRFELVRE